MPLTSHQVSRLRTVYYQTKDLFGPKISVQILDVTAALSLDHGDPEHVMGDNLWAQYAEGASLIGEVFKAAIGGSGDHVARLEQFPEFGRVIRLDLEGSSVAIVVSAELFDHPTNDQLFRIFKDHCAAYVLGRTEVLPGEALLSARLPSWLRGETLAALIEHLRRLSTQQVEQKAIRTGFALTSDYARAKGSIAGARFIDATGPAFRDMDRLRQPWLEVADGRTSFVVVEYGSDDEPFVRGLVFLPSPATSVPLAGMRVPPNFVFASIQTPYGIRVVAHHGTIFEIVDGTLRARDYSALHDCLVQKFEARGYAPHSQAIAREVLEISAARKGTILVFGPRLPDSTLSGGIRTALPLVQNGGMDSGPLAHVSHTDGAVLIDDPLTVYRFATILLVGSSTPSSGESTGGSRSLTAKRFSAANPGHLVVKISADGPVAVYEGGERLLEL